MVVDAVRAYTDATSGLAEPSRKRAVAAARTLIREGGGELPEEGVGQSIQALAAELIETGQSNREALAALVAAEVAAAVERLDVVPRTEYDRLARRVAELERRLAGVRAPLRQAPAGPVPAPAEERAEDRASAVPEPAVQTPAAAPAERKAGAGQAEGEKDAPAAEEPPARSAAGEKAAAAEDAQGADAEKAPAGQPEKAAGEKEESAAEKPEQEPGEKAEPAEAKKAGAKSGQKASGRTRSAAKSSGSAAKAGAKRTAGARSKTAGTAKKG
ncbi:hypothetical protein J0910_22315 [Nocardiopsis sp. CNT-189]|uniref:hypothetical protein n=1 Tax=Nocardiopsis oceanisediminis TaxID=2816862 RepID=UPI003B3376A8